MCVTNVQIWPDHVCNLMFEQVIVNMYLSFYLVNS